MNPTTNECCNGEKPRRGPRIRTVLVAIALLIVTGSVGVMAYRQMTVESTDSTALPAKIWTCVEHPEVRRLEPGRCPVCGKILVPAYRGPQPALINREAHPGQKPTEEVARHGDVPEPKR